MRSVGTACEVQVCVERKEMLYRAHTSTVLREGKTPPASRRVRAGRLERLADVVRAHLERIAVGADAADVLLGRGRVRSEGGALHRKLGDLLAQELLAVRERGVLAREPLLRRTCVSRDGEGRGRGRDLDGERAGDVRLAPRDLVLQAREQAVRAHRLPVREPYVLTDGQDGPPQ
jgi:hypothetical protein